MLDTPIIFIESLIYLIRILVPRCSALFPYTTLFRSKLRIVWDLKDGPRRYGEIRTGLLRGLDGSSEIAPRVDRKSTRLNSSHVAISYAVFCLKKKTFSSKRS